MRTTFVLVAGALLGMALDIVTGAPSAAGERPVAALSSAQAKGYDRLLCESLTWLRAPVMRAAGRGD
jgi:hypothetical protein